MSESSTPPGPMSTLAEMNLQRVGQRNREREQEQNHHRKQRRLQKEKRVQEKNVIPLVKRKAPGEKRDRE